MANQQVIAPSERKALAQESNFWKAFAAALIHDSFYKGHEIRPLGALWLANGNPIPNLKDEDQIGNQGFRLYHPAFHEFRGYYKSGNLHWLFMWNDGRRRRCLLASSQPINIELDSILQAKLVGVKSIAEAHEILERFDQEQSQNPDGFNFGFMNQPFGKPFPWSWIHEINVPQGMSREESISWFTGFFMLPPAEKIMYARLWDLRNPFHDLTESPFTRQQIIERCIYAHTAHSMHLRSTPRQIGQRHIEVNDAPSHGTTRALMILRLKELFPETYAQCSYLLPNTARQRIQRTLIEQSIPGITKKSIEALPALPEGRQRHGSGIAMPEDLGLTPEDMIAFMGRSNNESK